jgi:hypothetical protein
MVSLESLLQKATPMTHVQPDFAYSLAYYTYEFIGSRANTFEEVVDMLTNNDERYIEDVAEENGYDYDMYGEEPSEELKQAVAELAPEMAQHLIQEFAKEMKRWPEVTDNMKLTKAVNSLAPEILLFEDFQCCGTCARALLSSNYEEGKFPAETKGYATYNEQSTDRVAEGGPLYLGHSSFSATYDEAEDLRIAGKIVEALKAEGLDVEWDDSADRTIKINNMRWRRPFPPLVTNWLLHQF